MIGIDAAEPSWNFCLHPPHFLVGVSLLVYDAYWSCVELVRSIGPMYESDVTFDVDQGSLLNQTCDCDRNHVELILLFASDSAYWQCSRQFAEVNQIVFFLRSERTCWMSSTLCAVGFDRNNHHGNCSAQ